MGVSWHPGAVLTSVIGKFALQTGSQSVVHGVSIADNPGKWIGKNRGFTEIRPGAADLVTVKFTDALRLCC